MTLYEFFSKDTPERRKAYDKALEATQKDQEKIMTTPTSQEIEKAHPTKEEELANASEKAKKVIEERKDYYDQFDPNKEDKE